MKISCFFLALCASLSMGWAASPVIEESFKSLPDEADWKAMGMPRVEGNKLVLEATGNEASFANTGLLRKSPMDDLNFLHHQVEIQLSDLAMGGLASPEKQAFIVLLATDRPSESDAAAYLRLCVDGHGQVSLSVSSGEPGEGRALETLASGKVELPISRLALRLTPKGYRLEYTDESGARELEGEWTEKLDQTLWQGSAPMFVIKAVRRPSEGTTEVSLGGLKVVAP